MTTIPKTLPPFASALRAWRSRRTLTRAEGAALLGISRRTLEMWELGRQPSRPLWSHVSRKISAGAKKIKLDVDEATLKA